LSNEATPTTATVPTFGQLTFNRKTMLVSVTLSRQLLLQSDAEDIVRAELVRACAAEIDRVGIQGSGANGQPLGILNMPQITSTSGTALTYQTMVNQMAAVANSNAIVDPEGLGWLTTPNVANILKNRYFSTAQFPIWTGPIAHGTIDTTDAMATTNVPAAVLIHGDFSQLLIAEWDGGMEIDVDVYTGFQSAFVTVRLLVAVDFQIVSPTCFQLTTGVT
jgi:HK97 family phage major capsid protein